MRVSIADAERCLDDLASRAAAGEEVILMRGGETIVRLLPVQNAKRRTISRELIKGLQEEVRAKASLETSAARSQDFLYDENGLPA